MKKYILLFAFITTSLYAQQTNVGCSTTGFIPHDASFNIAAYKALTYDETTPYVINAFFTIVKAGTENNPFTLINGNGVIDTPEQTENGFLNCIKILNVAYNSSNIFFKYTGYQVVYNDAIYYNPFYPASYDINWEAISPYKKDDAMNFYFLNTFGYDTQVDTQSIIGGTENIIYIVNLISPDSYGLKYSLIHNTGHNLSLYHPYEAVSHYIGTPLEPYTGCEKVNRIPNSNPAIYNADIAGDEVEDTAARITTLNSTIDFEPNCGAYIYNANAAHQNCYFEPFENIVPNYMDTSSLSYCYQSFSAGQTQRMRKFIQYNTAEYNPDNYPTVRNDVISLYEPFYTQVFAGDIVSTEDQPDSGGALVCRSQLYKLRFQPGFNCEFSNTITGTILQTTEQQFNYNNTFNHAIGVKIPILSETINNAGDINSVLPYFCSFEPYTSGSLFSTAILGSMNITVEYLDAIKVKDPNLYEELMHQYYYILKKETATGAKIEKIFYKQ